jgi:hypothetical protein
VPIDGRGSMDGLESQRCLMWPVREPRQIVGLTVSQLSTKKQTRDIPTQSSEAGTKTTMAAISSDGDGEVHRIGFTLLKGSAAPKHGPFRAKYVAPRCFGVLLVDPSVSRPEK